MLRGGPSCGCLERMSYFDEILSIENKTVPITETAHWEWDVVRSAAAMYNTNGGLIRMGIDDSGKVIGGHDLKDYATDNSPFAKALSRYLDFPPPFLSVMDSAGYVEIQILSGVVAPTILRQPLEKFPGKKEIASCRHGIGTMLIRAYDDGKPSSRTPRSRAEWQAILHIWELNKGTALQAQILFEFMLLINHWDPFNPSHTRATRHQAKCVADTAKTFGRMELWEGLLEVVKSIAPANVPAPEDPNDRDMAGSDCKTRIAERINDLASNSVLAFPPYLRPPPLSQQLTHLTTEQEDRKEREEAGCGACSSRSSRPSCSSFSAK